MYFILNILDIEYNYLNFLKVITHKDRMAMIEEAERKRQQLEDESNNRKDILQRSLVTRSKQGGSKLNKVSLCMYGATPSKSNIPG